MRRVALQLATIAALLVTACAIPQRSNPADPASAPLAKLAIHVRAPDGTVSDSAEGGRASVFILDAGQSSDPLNRGPLHYFFETDDPAAGDAGNPSDFDKSLTPLGTTTSFSTALTLTTAMLPQRIGVATRIVKVKVVAQGGHFSVATASVVLRNRAPIVDAGGDLFVSKTRSVPVILDACGGAAAGACSTIDPDGDPLSFTWEQVDGAIPATGLIALDGSSQRVQFTSTAPAGPARGLTFRLRADDGLTQSVGYVSVYPSTQVWIGTRTPNRVYRFYPEFSVRDTFTAMGGGTTPLVQTDLIDVAATGDIWIGESFPDPTTVRHLDRDRQEIRNWPIPSNGGSLVSLVEQGTQGCAGFITIVGSTPTPQFGRLMANSTVVVSAPPASSPLLRAQVFPVTPDGAPGPCWAVNDDFVGQIALNGTLTAMPVTGAVFHTALAATSTPDGALWLSDYFGNLTATLIRIPPGGGPAMAIAAPTDTAYLFDHLFPDVDGTSVLAWNEFDRSVHRFGADGTVAATNLPPLLFRGAGVDFAGAAAWLLDGDREEIRRFAFRDGAFEETGTVPIQETNSVNAPYGALSVDATTGDLLVTLGGINTTAMLKAVVRIPPWLSRVTQIPFDANPKFGISADPSSGRFWYYEFGGALRKVRVDGTELYATGQGMPRQSAAAVDDGDAWTLVFTGTNSLDRIDGLGVMQESVPLPPTANTSGPIGVSSDFDTLCVGKYTGNNFRYRRSTATLESLTDSGNPYRQALAAPNGACWFFGDGVSTLNSPLVKYPAGSLTATVNETSVSGTDFQQDAWLALDPRDGTPWVTDTGNTRIVHLDAAGAVTTTFTPYNVEVLGLVPVCATVGNPGCVEVWRTQGLKVLRSDATLATPAEVLTISAGIPIAIDVVP